MTFTVKKAEGAERDYTGPELIAIQAAVDQHYEKDAKFRDAIQTRCFENAGDRDDDDGDAKYEAWRERWAERADDAKDRAKYADF